MWYLQRILQLHEFSCTLVQEKKFHLSGSYHFKLIIMISMTLLSVIYLLSIELLQMSLGKLRRFNLNL